MGKHVRVALLALGLLSLLAGAGACGRKPPRPEPFKIAPAAPKPRALPLAGADAYERDGSIKGSATRVEWLELPAAFKHAPNKSFGAHEVYEAEGLPFEKMCDFLSKRMFTGKVDLRTDSAAYHAVMPLDMNANALRLNVSLTQTKGRMTLDIERLPRADAAKPLDEDEARRLLAEERERAH